MALKTYLKSVKGFNLIRTFLLSQSGDRAKVHSVGEIDVALLRDDDVTNKLDEGVLLFVRKEVGDDETVKIMYPDGTPHILPVWKLKATCVEVIKVFDTDTTVDNADLFLSK